MSKLNNNVIIKDNAGKPHTIPALWDTTRARVSSNNSKTCIPSWSLLAGNSAAPYAGAFPAVLRPHFPELPATCPHDCPGCYAKMITRNIEPAIKYALNTFEALSNPARFLGLVELELFESGNPAPDYVRIHDSGEIPSFEYYELLCAMVARHPETNFGMYTKRGDIVERFGIENKPDNLILSCSPWVTPAGVVLCAPIGNLPQFIYDDHTNPDLETLPHCPAVDFNGKRTGVTCNRCRHCYTAKPGDRWAVYAH